MWSRPGPTTTASGHGSRTWLPLPWRDLAGAGRHCLRSIVCRFLIRRVQRLQKSHQRGGLRRAEVLSIRWHISSTLDHLANKLIFGQAQGNTIERRPALTSLVIQRMTVVTLFGLKNERTTTLQSRPTL